jgi:GT2 family glycosyltransferase
LNIGAEGRTTAAKVPEAAAVVAGPPPPPSAAAALYDSAVFLQAGGFDERYFCYFEDVDLGFRLRLAGHRALLVPGAVVHHGGSITSGDQSAFGIYHGRRNLIWTFIKNMPADLLRRYLIPHILMNLFMIVRFTLRGQGKTILKAEIDALRGLGSILRSRKTIQRNRRVASAELLRMMRRGWPARS